MQCERKSEQVLGGKSTEALIKTENHIHLRKSIKLRKAEDGESMTNTYLVLILFLAS